LVAHLEPLQPINLDHKLTVSIYKTRLVARPPILKVGLGCGGLIKSIRSNYWQAPLKPPLGSGCVTNTNIHTHKHTHTHSLASHELHTGPGLLWSLSIETVPKMSPLNREREKETDR
jgi:hypothetical protein